MGNKLGIIYQEKICVVFAMFFSTLIKLYKLVKLAIQRFTI
jgi:hypothetical protein